MTASFLATRATFVTAAPLRGGGGIAHGGGHHALEVQPERDRGSAIRGEDPRRRFEQTDPGARDLCAEEGRVVVESHEVDLGRDGRRQCGREGQLVTERQLRIDRDDPDVEVAAGARPAGGLRAEQHRQPKRRPVGQYRAEAILRSDEVGHAFPG